MDYLPPRGPSGGSRCVAWVASTLGEYLNGKRYSSGHPACPDLEGQRQLFAALATEEIGADLTDGDMMEPEARVSTLVFHQPAARHFGV